MCVPIVICTNDAGVGTDGGPVGGAFGRKEGLMLSMIMSDAQLNSSSHFVPGYKYSMTVRSGAAMTTKGTIWPNDQSFSPPL